MHRFKKIMALVLAFTLICGGALCEDAWDASIDEVISAPIDGDVAEADTFLLGEAEDAAVELSGEAVIEPLEPEVLEQEIALTEDGAEASDSADDLFEDFMSGTGSLRISLSFASDGVPVDVTEGDIVYDGIYRFTIECPDGLTIPAEITVENGVITPFQLDGIQAGLYCVMQDEDALPENMHVFSGGGTFELTSGHTAEAPLEFCFVNDLVMDMSLAARSTQADHIIGVGQTITLNPSALISGGGQYIFASSNRKIATVSSKGVVRGVKAGKCVIGVKSSRGQTAFLNVQVKRAPSSIRLNANSGTLTIGQQARLTASLSPADCMPGISFVSSDPSIVTVDENGTLTGVGAGVATVTAYTYNRVTATCRVTVESQPQSISLNYTSVDMRINGTKTLRVSFSPEGTTAAVAFRSSNTSVATVSSSGVITAKRAGQAIVAVRTANGLMAQCTVNVWVEPTAVALDQSTATMTVGDTLTLRVAVSPEYAYPAVIWASSDTSILTVSEGVVTAIKAGTARVGVKTINDKIAICTVTVRAAQTEPSEPTQPTGQKYIIDISKWNGNIDFDELKPHVSLVICRVSCRTDQDIKFTTYARAMNARGIPFGVYCYSHAADAATARAEVDAMVRYASPYHPKFYVLDAEEAAVTQTAIRAFAQRLREHGISKVGCYVGHHRYTQYGFADVKNLFDFVWIPRYGKNDGTVGSAVLPAYPCDLWQYTSNGTLPGISTHVDLNVLTGQGKPLSWFVQ